MKIVEKHKAATVDNGSDFARRWLKQNEDQIVNLAMMADTVFGTISRAVVSAWHVSARDYGIMTGTAGSPWPPVLQATGAPGGGFLWTDGVATATERQGAVAALERTGYGMIAKRVAVAPLGSHTLTIVTFIADRAEVYGITVTRPTDANESRIVLGSE